MGNFGNWLSNGSWAPNSNAAAEQAERDAEAKQKELEQQQKQLEQEQETQQKANEAKQINRLKSIASGSSLLQPTDKTNLLG
jgi:uncharacterized protein with WD repeat